MELPAGTLYYTGYMIGKGEAFKRAAEHRRLQALEEQSARAPKNVPDRKPQPAGQSE
jgi:hypothetical protein